MSEQTQPAPRGPCPTCGASPWHPEYGDRCTLTDCPVREQRSADPDRKEAA